MKKSCVKRHYFDPTESQEEIETRRVERSAPMPIMRRAQLSDQFSVPGSSMPTIEVGSGTFDRVGQLVDYGHFPGEDRVRESLEDAIEDTNPPSTARRLCELFKVFDLKENSE